MVNNEFFTLFAACFVVSAQALRTLYRFSLSSRAVSSTTLSVGYKYCTVFPVHNSCYSKHIGET